MEENMTLDSYAAAQGTGEGEQSLTHAHYLNWMCLGLADTYYMWPMQYCAYMGGDIVCVSFRERV